MSENVRQTVTDSILVVAMLADGLASKVVSRFNCTIRGRWGFDKVNPQDEEGSDLFIYLSNMESF